MPADPDQTATIVTSRAIRAGHKEEFDQWVDELDRLALAAPGYRAAIRLGQTAGFQHLLFRFDNQSAADKWQADAALKAHVAAADTFSTALTQTNAGNRDTFELPSDASASKWKRFATTWLTVFPILLIISFVVRERKRIQIVDFRGSKALSKTTIEDELKKKDAALKIDTFYDSVEETLAKNGFAPNSTALRSFEQAAE